MNIEREQFYADMESNCTLEIRGLNIGQRSPEFLAQVLAKAQRHMSDGNKLTLMCSSREPGRMLEWGLNIQYPSGGRLFIGIIQRKDGDEPEFNS